jgi:hypothetical protein
VEAVLGHKRLAAPALALDQPAEAEGRHIHGSTRLGQWQANELQKLILDLSLDGFALGSLTG